MAVTDVVHRVAVEIHEAAAGMVLDPDPLGLANRRETRRGHGLVQEVARVFREQVLVLRPGGARGPAPPQGGEVRLPFGLRRRQNAPHVWISPHVDRSPVGGSAEAPSSRDRGAKLRKVRRYPDPRPAHSQEGRKLRSGHQCLSLPAAGAPLETPISSRMLSTAASAPRISARPRRPMQPMRKEGAAVSLPG